MKSVSRILALLLGLWLLAVAVLFFFQEHLIFFPTPLDREALALLQRRAGFSMYFLPPPSGAQVFVQAPSSPAPSCLLYFGGNAHEASSILDDAPRMGARTLITSNYPGYGDTPGTPGEEAIERGALALL